MRDFSGPLRERAAALVERVHLLAAVLVRQLHRARWVLAVGLCVTLLAVASAAWETCMFGGCPDVERLKGLAPDRPSVVLDSDGNEFAKLFRTRRIFISIDSVPDYLPLAFVALEDRRFFRHHGIDWIRIGGAIRSNARGDDGRQGGSTITMQLARNLYPELLPPRERTISRKLREMQVAQQLERVLEKREILELYLNQIYFGEGAYGIEAAAREYFAKSAARLSLAEVAMLAALPRAPSRTNPRTNPERAKAGRDGALKRMAAARILTEAQAQALVDAPLAFSEKRSETGIAPWFLEEVRKQLEVELGDAVYTRGYRIFTTLDRDAQAVLEEELERQAQAVESGRLGRFMGPSDATLQFAGVVLDPATGDVQAMVGGRDFEESQFNRATDALRQPGSAFKPIVYAAALAAGFSPLHRLEDNPVQIVASDGAIWEPRNLSGEYDEEISMREALRLSRNVATVRLAHDVGLQNVARLAEQLGLRRRIPPYPSLALGTVETTPMAMTTAFATFATLGWRPRARLVLRVEDRQWNRVWSSEAATAPVLDNETAFLTLDLMRSVLEGGTGWRVREAGFWGPAAGKTGTTQDGADLWFTGVTPTRAATMWFGFDRRGPIVAGATAEDVAAPVWGRVMRRIVPDQNESWSAPRGLRRVDVDWDGQIVNSECTTSGTVYSAWVRATDVVPPPVCFFSAIRPYIPPAERRISIPRGPLRIVRPGGGR